MHLLDLTLPTLAENLALDEALLLDAEGGKGGQLLRLWEWPGYAVVLGAACNLAEDVDEPSCRRDQVPILRRASGGGTVLLGRGCLLFSLVLPYKHAPELAGIRSSCRFILGRIAAVLADVLPDVQVAGTSDLASGGRKLSGNAQQRKRRHLLHHGSILYDFDLDTVGLYLRQPPRQPAYREGRNHQDFLMNLPLAREDIQQRLQACWSATKALDCWPRERTQQLVGEKYGNTEWIRRC
jgi:lipoate-protein ligase A